jgi:hypothetical protein
MRVDDFVYKITEQLNITNGTFVEFGAWDGFHLCNTLSLRQKGWKGVYIESDKNRFYRLTKYLSANKKITFINASVEINGQNSLDNLLAEHLVSPIEIDFLSIDIDGLDLSVWKSIKSFKAKLVCIEYNASIPFDISYQQNSNINIGNSAKAIVDHAENIGYGLIYVDDGNLIFMDKRMRIPDVEIKFLTLDQITPIKRFAFGMNGELLYFENGKLIEWEYLEHPWGAGLIYQPYPSFIRGTSKYRYLQLVYNLFFTIIFRPVYVKQLFNFAIKKMDEIDFEKNTNLNNIKNEKNKEM